MTVLETTTNGVGRGRHAPLPTFTFPDSGITVSLRRLAPDTQQHIAQAIEDDPEWKVEHPRPEPPLQPVVNLEGTEELIPNPEEPKYKELLSGYLFALSAEIGQRMLHLALRQIVVDVDEGVVEQLREDMESIGAPIPDDADSRDIYIRRICISSVIDLEALMAYIQRRSGPTEAAIARHRAGFQG